MRDRLVLLGATSILAAGAAAAVTPTGTGKEVTMAWFRDAATHRGHVVRANGVNLYYEERGKGEPLLLLHAGSLTAEMWQPYLAAFAEHYRVITPDLRGHGRSDRPSGAMSYRLLAEDMAAFVRVLGLHRPLIAGFSDGGQVALEIGMRHPSLARALVVGGAQFKFSAAYRAWARDALGDETSPEVDPERLARNHPEWAAWLEQIYGPDDWKPLLTQLKPMWTTPLNYTPEDFTRVVAPTLVLVGDRDELVPSEEALEMYLLLPTAELAIVPGADHGAFFSGRAAAFRSLMLEFLLRHSGSAN